MKKIDPSLEVYSWIIKHQCSDKCPPEMINFIDYQSFVSNSILIKKHLELSEGKVPTFLEYLVLNKLIWN